MTVGITFGAPNKHFKAIPANAEEETPTSDRVARLQRLPKVRYTVLLGAVSGGPIEAGIGALVNPNPWRFKLLVWGMLSHCRKFQRGIMSRAFDEPLG